MEPVLQAVDISRRFGEYQALKPTHFDLNAGQAVILSGPNGAGKFTLLLVLSGLLAPTTGKIVVDGHNLYEDEPAARRALAYVPDVPAFYHELTAWEHLSFIAQAHGAADGDAPGGVEPFEERAAHLLTDLGLYEARNLFPHAYSRGMRLKLALALAFIRPFRVLLLDEPTSALDSGSTLVLAEKLRALRSQGTAVLLTTHDPAFAARLEADHWRMQDGELHTDE